MVFLSVHGADAEDWSTKIDQLRSEVGVVPTNAENCRERGQILYEWMGRIERTGVFLPPDGPTVAFRATGYPEEVRGRAAFRRVDQLMEALALQEKGQSALGYVSIDPDDPVRVLSWGTWELRVKIGSTPIPTGGLLLIGQQFQSTWGFLQCRRPASPNYVTARTTGRATLSPETIPILGVYGRLGATARRPGFRVVEGELREGDEVIFTLGDTSQGSRGSQVATFTNDRMPFLVMADYKDDKNFVPIGAAYLKIIGGDPDRISGVVPSIAGPGAKVALRLRVEDAMKNPVSAYEGEIAVRLGDRVVAKVPVDGASAETEIVLPDKGGAYTFDLSAAHGLQGETNPVWVRSDGTPGLFWGELHGHCGMTDGLGSVKNYFSFARDFAYLDFVTLSDHDLWLTKPEWEHMRDISIQFDEPGRLITYMGYEWTRHFRFGGHHNVYFRDHHGKYYGIRTARSPQELYAKLAADNGAENVLVIPHAHNPGDWRAHDVAVQRLVEIMSKHGSFEYFGRRFLDNGYRLGFIAASDDHLGHPGYPPKSYCEGGLAAVWAERMDRNTIYDAMRDRHAYSTTGARIILDFSMNGVPKGGDVEDMSAPRKYRARVIGTAPLLCVDLMGRGGFQRSWKIGAAPSTADNRRLRVAFHSKTETLPEDGIRRPLGGEGWRGQVEFVGTEPSRVTPFGLERGAIADTISREESTSIVTVGCVTRGDEDGFVAELDSAAGGKLVFRFGDEQTEIALADIPPEGKTLSVSDVKSIRLDWLAPDPPRETTLEWEEPAPAEQGAYEYIRVTQVDGQMAWSSPIWFDAE